MNEGDTVKLFIVSSFGHVQLSNIMGHNVRVPETVLVPVKL